MKLIKKVKQIFKTETVLCIAGAAAVASMYYTPPSSDYLSYIDFRVLGLLFCLMTVVAGFNKTGVFLMLSEKLLHKTKNTRSLCYILIILCFFTSMWITNDVALITFVPFAVLLLSMTGQRKHLIFVIVLQTIAANLGSMLTPVGNPQNLYLYSYYNIPIMEFLIITVPVTVISFLLLSASVLLIKKETLDFTMPEKQENNKTVKSTSYLTVIYAALFLVCLLCVLRLIDYRLTLAILLSVLLIFDRGTLKKVDYMLLLTFVCFFIFVGNIGSIPEAKVFLAELLKGRELAISVLVSQGISNVPAAVLLSAFTTETKSLLLGTNLGGLGTIVASLASLISFKLYCKSEGAKPFRYLGIFTLYNCIFLLLLSLFILIN